MANETNAAGEASSSRRKRQRVQSIVEDEGENGGGDDEVARFGTLLELDLLDCSICCNALTVPIFQCDNGHIACFTCCIQVRRICPSCTFPIGHYRSRIMEKIIKAVLVPCRNAKHGCTEKFSYGKELAHEMKCSFALCYCPVPNCNYSGLYKDLYSHYAANHKCTDRRFRYGYSHQAFVSNEKICVLQEYSDGPLVVVQCFEVPQGFYVTANCIAPSAPGVGEFSYNLTYSYGGTSLTFEMKEMNRIQKVSFQTPEKDFMLVPDYFLNCIPLEKSMRICIGQIEKEEEAEQEEEEADVEAENEEDEAEVEAENEEEAEGEAENEEEAEGEEEEEDED